MSLDFRMLYKAAYGVIEKMAPGHSDFRLEGAIPIDDKQTEVIVSYLLKNHNSNKEKSGIAILAAPPQYDRSYKRIVLDENGQASKVDLYNVPR